jgi:hypothetical protein
MVKIKEKRGLSGTFMVQHTGGKNDHSSTVRL